MQESDLQMPLFSWCSRIGGICASCKANRYALLLLSVLRLVSQPLPKHLAPPLHTPLPLGRFARYPTSRSSSSILATTSDAILVPLLQLTAVPDSPSHWFSLEHYYLVSFGFGRAHRSSPCMHVPPKWYLRISLPFPVVRIYTKHLSTPAHLHLSDFIIRNSYSTTASSSYYTNKPHVSITAILLVFDPLRLLHEGPTPIFSNTGLEQLGRRIPTSH